MTKLAQLREILAKSETTYGTDATPTGASNAILVNNLSFTLAQKMNARVAIKPTFAPKQSVPGAYSVEVSFDVECKGSGTAGTVSQELDPLLQACGTQETTVASTSCTYAPLSLSPKSVTIYYNDNGTNYKLVGCYGNCQFSLKSGGIGVFKFKFSGHLLSKTDGAAPTPTFTSVVPPVALNVPVTLGAYTPILTDFSFDLGNKVEMPESIGATDGYANFLISSRDVKGSLTVEATTIAAKDWYGDMQAGTTHGLTLVVGATAGNIITFNMNKLYITDVKESVANGLLMYTVAFGAAETSGDDEYSIALT